MFVWLVILLFFFIILLNLLLPKRYNNPSAEWKMFKIPGPPCLPHLGHAHLFFKSSEMYLYTLVELLNKYKKICKIDFLGIHNVFLTDVDDIKVIMNSKDHITKSDDYLLLLPWLGTGLLTSSGKKWFDHRKWLTPAFHFKILDQYIDIINKNGSILVDTLMDQAELDFVYIDPLISLCTLDIICETAMGTEINAQTKGDSEYVKAILKMGHLFRRRQHSPWLHREWVFALSPTGREQKKVLNILHGFTEKIINERKEAFKKKQLARESNELENLDLGEKKKISFLDLLIEISETQNKMTDIEIREEVDTFMFEGHDTTSASLTWTLFELGCHPEIQEKAYQEQKAIFRDSDKTPTHADLAEMKYLERIIKESLRLYPSVAIISRKVEEDVTIRGYDIPAGTCTPIFIYYIHRDPELYPDPEKFDPERFLPDAIQGRHPFSYIPFSAGPRNCIGQRFAMMEEKIILAQIIRNFEIVSLDNRDEIIKMSELVLKPKHNLRIKFKPRKASS